MLDQSPRRPAVSACRCAQVCGVHGSWHLGQLQIGLSRPIKLAQCHTARITLLEAIPVQMDGEPWHQPPATLEVSLHGQVQRSAAHNAPQLLDRTQKLSGDSNVMLDSLARHLVPALQSGECHVGHLLSEACMGSGCLCKPSYCGALRGPSGLE